MLTFIRLLAFSVTSNLRRLLAIVDKATKTFVDESIHSTRRFYKGGSFFVLFKMLYHYRDSCIDFQE